MAQTQPNPTPSDINHDSKAAPRDAAAAKNGSQKTNLATDPLALLSADHRSVEQLFDTFEKTMDAEQKSQLAKQICTELVIHALLEEEIFYPACEDKVELKLLDEAQVEHDGAKALIIEIQGSSPTDRYYDALVKVLSEDIKHHVREEEKPDQGIFAKAKEAGVATAELAAQLVTRKQKLMEEAKAESLGPPETRSLRARIKFGKSQGGKEPEMARGSSSMDRERDDRGRFVSDDDDDDRRGGPRSRSREDDDDDRRSSRSRDDEGRFTSSRLALVKTTMITVARRARGMMKAASPARARVPAMTMTTTGVAAVVAGTAAGSAIPKGIRGLLVKAGMTAAARVLALVKTTMITVARRARGMTKAASPAREPVPVKTTTMIVVVALAG